MQLHARPRPRHAATRGAELGAHVGVFAPAQPVVGAEDRAVAVRLASAVGRLAAPRAPQVH
eukprot:921812-Pyramimonas_sp.AAC.1